ncbi:phage GP46 family protein [Oligella urethralis]|uniref:phage GP46 family protein n=1 Tax=Oligella urethralis TaxID=90245 RepID=UPI00288B13EA|nr:phage GP46 family protein [Oligella urethralis]
MDASLNPLTADYDGQRINTLANAVYIRLMTPLGGWWADPLLGSRLHELVREKNLTRIYKLAEQYAEQALEPLIKTGRASRIDVTATPSDIGWCLLHIKVTDISGKELLFQHHIGVA